MLTHCLERLPKLWRLSDCISTINEKDETSYDMSTYKYPIKKYEQQLIKNNLYKYDIIMIIWHDLVSLTTLCSSEQMFIISLCGTHFTRSLLRALLLSAIHKKKISFTPYLAFFLAFLFIFVIFLESFYIQKLKGSLPAVNWETLWKKDSELSVPNYSL